VLFHVTIGHDAQDCPGRRPTELTGLVAPSDTRDVLASQLKIKLHFVLWGAACMLWAQPEHLAFAVVEAEDVEAVMQYVGALVPQSWTYKVRPVWNLPSQLRLIRQVQLAPTMLTGETLAQPEPMPTQVEAVAEPETSEPEPPESPPVVSPRVEPPPAEQAEEQVSVPASNELAREPRLTDDADAKTVPPVSVSFPPGEPPEASVSFPPGEPPEAEEAAHRAPVAEVADAGDPAAHRTWPQTEPDAESPSTITRLLEELETPADTPEGAAPGGAGAPTVTPHRPATDQATHIEQFVPPPPPRTRAWLISTNGPTRGSSYQLPLDSATVGRLPENTIYIPDERLSREHARIDFRDGKFVLTDLGSRNGTAVNGTLLSAPQPLNNGDIIELGSNTLVVNIETEVSSQKSEVS
jgi:hypothetical protein